MQYSIKMDKSKVRGFIVEREDGEVVGSAKSQEQAQEILELIENGAE